MRHTRANRIAVLAGSLLLSAAAAPAAELRDGPIALVVDQQGCGLIDGLTFRGGKILAAHSGFIGAQIKLTDAADGSADSLFRRRVTAVLRAHITRLLLDAGAVEADGWYSDGKTRVPFWRRISILAGRNAVSVREFTDFTALPDRYLVAAHSLDLPLVLCPDEHLRMFGFEAANRAELYRMDMNDEHRRSQSISSSRAFWPYWDLGGIQRDRGTYRLWRANHADTIAYPIETGRGSPGWADYSDLERGMTVQTSGSDADSGPSMTIDARKGVFSVLARGPWQLPVSGKQYGRRDVHFLLRPHGESWPAAWPCELDFATYRGLLLWLNRGGSYTHLDCACGLLGIDAHEGAKTPAQLDDICRRIIFKERIQPSVLLRTFYGGEEGWRMADVAGAVLGRHPPREQPLSAWESLAAQVLAKVRRSGVPRS